jgi:hypothetical protein
MISKYHNILCVQQIVQKGREEKEIARIGSILAILRRHITATKNLTSFAALHEYTVKLDESKFWFRVLQR